MGAVDTGKDGEGNTQGGYWNHITDIGGSRSVVNVTVVIGLSNDVLSISKKLGEKIWNVLTTKT